MNQPLGYALSMLWRSAPRLLFVTVLSSFVYDESTIPSQEFSINCDIWHVEKAIPIFQTLIVDMLGESSLGSNALEYFSKR